VAVRMLLVMAVLIVLYGCGQSSPAPQGPEKEGGVEPKTVTPSGASGEERRGEPTPQVQGDIPIARTIGESVEASSFDLRILDYFVSDSFYYLADPYFGQPQAYVSEAGKFVVVNYSVTNTSAETIRPTPMGRLHAGAGDTVEVYEQNDQIVPGGRMSPEMRMDEIAPRQVRVSQFVFDVPDEVDPELVAVTDGPTVTSSFDVGAVDLTESDPQGPRPEEILALQYEYGNMAAYEQAYELFAQETKERVSEQTYVFAQERDNQENSIAFTGYSFPSVDVRGDRATIERVATYSNEDEAGRDKATQEMVLEDDGWRIVMRDEQYDFFLGGGETAPSNASASGTASASP
jgi:hypothetical protein